MSYRRLRDDRRRTKKPPVRRFRSISNRGRPNEFKALLLEQLGTEMLIPTALRLIARTLDSHFVSFQACDSNMTILGGDTYPSNDVVGLPKLVHLNR